MTSRTKPEIHNVLQCHLGMYRNVNFTIWPEPNSKCAIRLELEPDSTKAASQA